MNASHSFHLKIPNFHTLPRTPNPAAIPSRGPAYPQPPPQTKHPHPTTRRHPDGRVVWARRRTRRRRRRTRRRRRPTSPVRRARQGVRGSPRVDRACFQRLKPNYDIPLSDFSFNFINLRRYTPGASSATGAVTEQAEVGIQQ